MGLFSFINTSAIGVTIRMLMNNAKNDRGLGLRGQFSEVINFYITKRKPFDELSDKGAELTLDALECLAEKYGVDGAVKLLAQTIRDAQTEQSVNPFVTLIVGANGGLPASLDSSGVPGQQQIHVAAQNGDIKTIKLLLEKGAIANAADNEGRQAIHLAAEHGFLDIVKLLVEKNVRVNVNDNNGQQPAYWAILDGHIDIVKFLLEKGARVDAADNFGRQLIHAAASSGRAEIVKLLLEKGARASAADHNGEQPLHKAAEQGSPRGSYNETIVRLLMGGAKINAVDHSGRTPIHSAATRGNSGFPDDLIQEIAENGGSHIFHHNTGVLQTLVEK